MKTVFNTQQTIHVWASQKQESGKNSNRSVFFQGPSIFSYGSHFEMARHIKNDVVFITNRKYSVTTAKHLSWVQSAVRHKTVFMVPSFTDHAENVRFLVDKVKASYDSAKRALKSGAFYIEQAQRHIDTTQRYLDTFHLSISSAWLPELVDLWASLIGDTYLTTEERNKIAERRVRAEHNELIRAEKRRLEQAIRDQLRALEEKEKLSAWMNGEDVGYRYRFAETRLRIKGDTVQTSKGAEVPVIEARKLYRAWKLGVDMVGRRVGYFTVSSMDHECIHIGCHTIPMSEVERIAPELMSDSKAGIEEGQAVSI